MPTPLSLRPAAEQARVEALRRYAILDTPPEPVFDQLIAEAARACGYEAGVLSIMDADRAWFKARYGRADTPDMPWELPRDQTFCNHAFLSSGLFVVPDARLDPRFAHLLAIDRPDGIRAYAGMQLITPDGFSIGSLALLHFSPREPSPEQRAAHHHFAIRAMELIETRRRSLPPSLPTADRRAVLIVDDEESIRHFTQALLQRRGLTVYTAVDGAEAATLYRAHASEIGYVLTDHNMPGLTGLELIRDLRSSAHPPVFAVMTGRLTSDLRRAFLAEGVSCVLEKPFTLADFEDVCALFAPAPAHERPSAD